MNILHQAPAEGTTYATTEEHYRHELAHSAREAFRRQLTDSRGGVISLRLPEKNRFLITPSDTEFTHIGPEDMCLIDDGGALLDAQGDKRLPGETKYHLKSLAVRTDIQAIAHLYPRYASLYADRETTFDLLTKSARSRIKEVLRVQCAECISRFCGLCSCHTDIRTSYAGVDVLLLKEDGLVVLGSDLEDVLSLAGIAEETAEQSYQKNGR